MLLYAGWTVLSRRLQTWLIGAQAVGFATLLRSVAFDRWITVLAAALLVVGAATALRGRTWGVVLAFASSMAFPVAWLIGIAPAWFAGVGVIGAMPFLLTYPALARVDRRAAALLALLAGSAGALGAVTWKLVAWDAIHAFPSLWPSGYPRHPLAVSALLALGMVVMIARSRKERDDLARIDVSERTRLAPVDVADAGADASFAEAEAEAQLGELDPIGDGRPETRLRRP